MFGTDIVSLLILSSITSFVDCEMEGYIVGGKSASVKEHPHAAYLLISCNMGNQKNDMWGCGASILNQDILLTAAHCLEECKPVPYSMVKVSVGSEKNNEKYRFIKASKFVTHPGYNPVDAHNDIALLRMEKSLALGKLVKKVILLDYLPQQTKATIVGWGLIDEVKQLDSPFLKVAEQRILPKTECLKLLRKFDMQTMICTRSNVVKGYPAEGDSGGALMVSGGFQVGLVSFKLPNVARNIVVFTDVSKYYKWIVKTAGGMYCTADYSDEYDY